MVILPSSYLAPIPFYAAMMHDNNVCIEQYDNYVKQTFRNRCVITGPNGAQTLTIPVEKPTQHKSLMRDLRISDHGNWRHLHWNALISSYGKSPFFEYYADDLQPFYQEKWDFLVDFNEALQNKIFELLDLDIITQRTEAFVAHPDAGTLDLRGLAEPSALKALPATPYYQVFASKNGFVPHLSIVDLLFNMGPESVLILDKS